MTSTEISELAKTYADAILTNQITRAEVVMLLACITIRINQAILIGLGTPSVAAPVKAGDVAKEWKPGVKIADKGYPCVCVMCAKHIYTVNKDVYDNTVVKDFIESYTPMPGFPVMTRQMKISNIENNITTNCPSCGGELTLYLAGRQISG
jgi:hypothetical protein